MQKVKVKGHSSKIQKGTSLTLILKNVNEGEKILFHITNTHGGQITALVELLFDVAVVENAEAGI